MTKVLVIGARRRRQGTGEFLARAFALAGAEVGAIVGTSAETAGQAQAQLREQYGIRCAAYTSVAEALERETPDIVAICSPHAVHYEQLQAVQQAGAHCLCEKPLWWGQADDRRAATERLVDGFIERGRFLALVTQWPYTLGAFYCIFPGLQGQPVNDFRMTLSPIRSGLDMILDSAPHPLSMLRQLLGYGRVASPHARFIGAGHRHLELDFEYRHGAGTAAVNFTASVCSAPPRPASYAINGARIEREIALPEYRVAFVGDGRRVAAEDPLQLLVTDFLNKVDTRCTVDRQALIDGVAGLEILFNCTADALAASRGTRITPARN